jgi:hypothetical protein
MLPMSITPGYNPNPRNNLTTPFTPFPYFPFPLSHPST